MNHNTPILSVAAFATLGVIARPRRIPEYVWPVIGAVGFLPWRNSVTAAAKGIDVYLFLIGVMLLAEVGRREGLFDWLAAIAVRYARGSADVPPQVTSGILVGTVIGPNLSVTASLATILWLIALRREGETVTAWQFLKLGIVVMPPGLVAALLAATVVS